MVMHREAEYARDRYFAWRTNHPHLADDPSEAWAAAWREGAWDAVRRNNALGLNLSQIIQRLEELYALYSDVEHDLHVERELEKSSVYWKNES